MFIKDREDNSYLFKMKLDHLVNEGLGHRHWCVAATPFQSASL